MIRLAVSHPEWVLGYADEVWSSRLRQPRLSSWAEGDPLRLIEQRAERADPDPKAPACYGLLRADTGQIWLRFVDGRPVSGVTTQFLAWSCERLRAEGKRALLLVWDNAAWHISQEVRAWIKAHNRAAKRRGGVRILACRLPTRSPWPESDRALLGTWQAGGGRARSQVDRGGIDRPHLWLLWM